MQVSRCVVPECSGRRGHTFPQDPIRQENWLKAVKWQREEKPHKAAFVCRQHFKKSDYKHQRLEREVQPGVKIRLRLKRNAVPSIFEQYDNSANSKDGIPLLIEVGEKEKSPLCDISFAVGELAFTLEDGLTESEVEASVLNALDCSSPIEDNELSAFGETACSKLWDDSGEPQSIFLPTGEGMLEITNNLQSDHPLDYDLDNGEEGFIAVSGYLAGFDKSDVEGVVELSDIKFPVKNKTLASELDEGSSLCLEPLPSPSVTNIIVFDANEEGVSTMKLLLLAQLKADQMVPLTPLNPIDTHPSMSITVEPDAEPDDEPDAKPDAEPQNVFEPQNQTEFITEGIHDLKLTPDPPTPCEHPITTLLSKSDKIISEIKKSLPKVLVNKRRIMLIKKPDGRLKFITNNDSSVTPTPSVECEPKLSSEPTSVPIKGSTVDLIVKTFTRRRPQAYFKRAHDMKKKGGSSYFCITKRSTKISSPGKKMERGRANNYVTSSDALTITKIKTSDGNSDPKTNEITSSNEKCRNIDGKESSNQDDDQSLGSHFSVSSEAGSSDCESRLADLEVNGNPSKSNETNIADSEPTVDVGGLLTIDLDSDEEKDIDERSESAETTIDVESVVEERDMKNSSELHDVPSKSPDIESSNFADKPTEMLNRTMESSSRGVDLINFGNDAQIIVVDSPHVSDDVPSALQSSSNVSPQTESNKSYEAISVTKDANKECLIVDLTKPTFTHVGGSGSAGVDTSDVCVCLDEVEPNQFFDEEVNPEENTVDYTIRQSPYSDCGDIDVGNTVTILDEHALQRIFCTTEDEKQNVSGMNSKQESVHVTDTDQTDIDCSGQLVQEDCLQFEVVSNDSVMILDEILSVTLDPVTRQPEISKNVTLKVRQSADLLSISNASVPYAVPDYMLFRKKRIGRPPKLRMPPPLILPDHNYTHRSVTGPRSKKMIQQLKQRSQLKPCYVSLERICPSILDRYEFSTELKEEPVTSPPSSSPPAEHLICFHCSLVLQSTEMLCTHITSHHTENIISCPRCGDNFTSALDCNNHIGTCDFIVEDRTSHITYLCPQCDFSTKDDSMLRGHIDVEHRVQCNYSCSLCPFKCVSELALQNHSKRYHSLNTSVVSSVVQSSSLVQSRTIAVTSQLIKVLQPASSVQDNNVGQTIRWRRSCPMCNFKCMSETSLKLHMKSCRALNSSVVSSSVEQSASSVGHTIEEGRLQQDFPCPMCQLKFLSEPLLQNHLKVPHADSCKACPLKFVTLHELRNHTVHNHNCEFITTILPLSCTQCSFKSESEQVLQLHTEVYHPIKGVMQSSTSVQSKPVISISQIHQPENSVPQPVSSANQQVNNLVQVPKNIVRVRHSPDVVRQPHKLVRPTGNTSQQSQSLVQQPSDSLNPQTILVRPSKGAVQLPSSLVRPQPIPMQPPGKGVQQPEHLVLGNAQQEEKTLVKCIFPATRPNDQFVPLVPAYGPTPPPTPKSKTIETEIDLTDDADDGEGIQCPECNETKESYADLGRHIVERHSRRKTKTPHRCHCCSKSFATRQGLKQHIKQAHGSVLCPEGCSYIPRTAIHQHMVRMHRSECFLCFCNFITTVNSVMQLHKMAVHKMLPDSEIISCPVCPPHTTYFKNLQCLITHANQRHFFLFKKKPPSDKSSAGKVCSAPGLM